MNTDQGSQFTGSAWITTLTEAGVHILGRLGETKSNKKTKPDTLWKRCKTVR